MGCGLTLNYDHELSEKSFSAVFLDDFLFVFLGGCLSRWYVGWSNCGLAFRPVDGLGHWQWVACIWADVKRTLPEKGFGSFDPLFQMTCLAPRKGGSVAFVDKNTSSLPKETL